MTVTPESNLALIQQLQDLVSSAAEPPSGPEFSYPVVDQAVSSSMWKWITRGMGAGILGEGGQPYWYRNVSNANNTAEIAVSTISGEAHAMIGGYYHHLSQAVTVQLPMPASGTVTYHVALTYDPRRESDPEGPIKLETHTGSLPTTFDREHIPLVTVTRRANELLTDADVQQHRPFVSPTVTYNRVSELPPASTMLSGTVARTRTDGGLYMALRGNEVGEDGESATSRWVNLGDPAWQALGLNSFYAPGGAVPTQIQRRGKARRLRGQFRRANQSESLTAGNRWFVTTLPTRDRPYNRVKIPVATSNDTVTATIDIMANGEVYFITPRAVTWATLDGIEYDVE